MRIYQRRNAWFLDYSRDGRRVRKRIGTSRKLAELAMKAVEVELIKSKYLGIREPKKMLFEKLCANYLEYSRANKTHYTWVRDSTSVKTLLKSFQGRQIASITAYDVECFKNLRSAKLKNTSINRELSCIKHMFTKAVDWGFLPVNPLHSVKKMKEPPGRVRYLTDEEITTLLNCCNGHVKSIVVTVLNSVLRRGEVLGLKWSDVDLKNRVLTIHRTKNNEMKMVPVNQELHQVLSGLGPQLPDQYVFANAEGGPFLDIKKGFHAAMRRAGIKDFRFHDLRHTFASRLVMAGVDIRTVQVLLGHKDIKMTLRYSHLSDTHLRDAVQKLEHGTNLAPPPENVSRVS
jgi:site-specific recombinase XerD